jgi:hypothetical protein
MLINEDKIKGFFFRRFEIALEDLPPRLERRFSFYLNWLANLEKAGLYGCLSVGLILSVIAVTRVAIYASKSYSAQQYNHNLVGNSVYNPCEVKCSKQNESMRSDCDEDESDDRECLNIIRREDEYELENDDALSDIEYNEINDEEESTSSSEQVCKFTLLLFISRPFFMSLIESSFELACVSESVDLSSSFNQHAFADDLSRDFFSSLNLV